MNADFRIRVADWEREREAMRAVRTEVFIQEQHILPQDEWDELDPLWASAPPCCGPCWTRRSNAASRPAA